MFYLKANGSFWALDLDNDICSGTIDEIIDYCAEALEEALKEDNEANETGNDVSN